MIKMGISKRSLNQKENFYYDKLENFNQDYLLCHDGYLSLKDEVVATRNYFMLVSKKTEVSRKSRYLTKKYLSTGNRRSSGRRDYILYL